MYQLARGHDVPADCDRLRTHAHNRSDAWLKTQRLPNGTLSELRISAYRIPLAPVLHQQRYEDSFREARRFCPGGNEQHDLRDCLFCTQPISLDLDFGKIPAEKILPRAVPPIHKHLLYRGN